MYRAVEYLFDRQPFCYQLDRIGAPLGFELEKLLIENWNITQICNWLIFNTLVDLLKLKLTQLLQQVSNHAVCDMPPNTGLQ